MLERRSCVPHFFLTHWLNSEWTKSTSSYHWLWKWYRYPRSNISSYTICVYMYVCMYVFVIPSVLWRRWLGGRKVIRPVKTEWWGAGVVICLERDADLHMAQLMPLPLTVSCFRLVLPFWSRLTWVGPEKGPLNRCVYVCICCCECGA